MNQSILIMAISASLFSNVVLAGAFNLQRGDLADTDSIDVEWHTQSGNCPTLYPVTSVNCTYTSLNAMGIKAIYIGPYSQAMHFTTDNTYLLNISINHIPVDSCKMLQLKIAGRAAVIINKTGCVISAS